MGALFFGGGGVDFFDLLVLNQSVQGKANQPETSYLICVFVGVCVSS